MKKRQKGQEKYICELCDFNTSHKTKYDRHLTTDKHKILTNPNEK